MIVVGSACAAGVPILSDSHEGIGIVVDAGIVDDCDVPRDIFGRGCVDDGGFVGAGDKDVERSAIGHTCYVLVEDRPLILGCAVPRAHDVVVVHTGFACWVPVLSHKNGGVGVVVSQGVIDQRVVEADIARSSLVGKNGAVLDRDVDVKGRFLRHGGNVLVKDSPLPLSVTVPDADGFGIVGTAQILGIPVLGDKKDGTVVAVEQGMVKIGPVAGNIVRRSDVHEMDAG